MPKSKGPRSHITIECIECRKNINGKGTSRYITSKNRRNLSEKLELKKYCKYCKKHTIHKEIK